MQSFFTRCGTGTFVTEDEDRVRQMKEEMAEGLVRQFLERMEKPFTNYTTAKGKR